MNVTERHPAASTAVERLASIDLIRPSAVSGSLCDGMTLRDYFAASSLAHLPYMLNQDDLNAVAKMAYEVADAMLAVRETGGDA